MFEFKYMGKLLPLDPFAVVLDAKYPLVLSPRRRHLHARRLRPMKPDRVLDKFL